MQIVAQLTRMFQSCQLNLLRTLCVLKSTFHVLSEEKVIKSIELRAIRFVFLQKIGLIVQYVE